MNPTMKMNLPRLGYIPLHKNTCVWSCLVAVAKFFGKTFSKDEQEYLLQQIREQGGLDAERIEEYAKPLDIDVECKEAAGVEDIEAAINENVPCAVIYQTRHPHAGADSQFSRNHMGIVAGISKNTIWLADTSFRRGQIPLAIPLQQFLDNWWAGDSDFYGNTIPEKTKQGMLYLFRSTSAVNMRGNCIWDDIPRISNLFAIIEKGEEAIWEYEYQRDYGHIDLQLVFIEESGEVRHRTR